MSFWSSLGKLASAVGSVAGPVVSIANPILGAGITAGSSALGKMSTDYENKKAISNANSANLAENQKNRDFNSQEAEKQRQFEAEQARIANEFSANQAQLAFQRESGFAQKMWKMENDYNSPNAQLQRLRDAGYNPNLFGGDNTAGSVGSASSPAPTGAMPHSSSASIGGSLSVSPYTLTNPALEAAQIRIANAQARQAETNADRTEQLLPGELKIQGMSINLGNADIELKRSQKDEIKSKMDLNSSTIRNLDEKTNNLLREGRLLDLDEKSKSIFLKQYEERLMYELLQMKSKLRLDEANIKHIASQIALNASQQALNYANVQNAQDVHLLNGLELRYKDKLMKLHYDTESNSYQLSLLDNAKESRIKGFRANESNVLYRIVNGALDDVEIITRLAGNVFGQMPDYIKKK